MSSVLQIAKEAIKGVVLAALVLLVVFFSANAIVYSGSRNGFTSVQDAPRTDVVVVLGASVLRSGKPSSVLEDRLLTALELYEAEKIQKFLLSGDNGQRDYDEVNVMKAYLLEKGVAAEDIFLDHAGFDSYDSLYRAKHVFNVDEALIVTQRFHLPRVIYLARSLGVNVLGVPADKHVYGKIKMFIVREWFANVKAVYDILFNSKPTYLGEPVSIEENGQVTWD